MSKENFVAKKRSNRITYTTTVDPVTLLRIQALADKTDLTLGKVIDRAILSECKKEKIQDANLQKT